MINFYDSKGELVTQGDVKTSFDITLGPKVSSCTADGDELDQAWELLGRSGRPHRQKYIFVDENAEELLINWEPSDFSKFE